MRQRNKVILASLLVVAVSAALYATYVTITPNWSFEITTGKPVYNLGENIQITVTLKNKGYVAHSFTSAVNNPILVSVEYVSPSNPTVKQQVWYTPFQSSETAFTVAPNQPLTRTYTWNQTNTQNPQSWNTTYREGTYFIDAFIPEKGAEPYEWGSGNKLLFHSWTYINVTAT